MPYQLAVTKVSIIVRITKYFSNYFKIIFKSNIRHLNHIRNFKRKKNVPRGTKKSCLMTAQEIVFLIFVYCGTRHFRGKP